MILDRILDVLQTGGRARAYTEAGGDSCTYDELYSYVSNLYHFLRDQGISGSVAVYGHKQVYMKAAFLACSFAGLTYIPIDSCLPRERIEAILAQAQPALLIGDLDAPDTRTLSRRQVTAIMETAQPPAIEKILMRPEDIYYIIFTSGSTGTPKGVRVTYANLDSCLRWLEEITAVGREVILNQANFSFDLSVADLYLSLVTGSEQVVFDDTAVSGMDFAALFRGLAEADVTMAVMTPSFADWLMLDRAFDKTLLPRLHTILFCGEKLATRTVRKLYDRFGAIRIINSYGPTECTFAVTSVELSEQEHTREPIPIGRPKKDVEIFVVDADLTSLPEGQVGEILIVGDSVAAGYLGAVGETAFIPYHGKPAYLTGDLGWMQDGMLYYQCRKDKQIKYKGYRIELSDIESNLLKLGYIDKAVAVARTNRDGKVSGIYAFVKLKDNAQPDVRQIEADLAEKLPSYMRPKIRIVDEFPLNRNGKCDEKRLLEEYR